jgi:uncharacterized protein (UPF0264 family)
MPIPHLLVSVRSLEEAAAALEGGADLIDVKEPARGPLGRSERDIISRIVQHVRMAAPDVPVSAALGELPDLRAEDFPGPVDYVKVGLAGCRCRAGWQQSFFHLQQRFEEQACAAWGFGPRWIAVAYADYDAAEAPAIADVLDLAVEGGCDGILIDTHSKTGRRLSDSLPAHELARWIDRAHEHDLFVACAGRLCGELLPEVLGADPDIVAIRAAACTGGDRLAPIDPVSVRRFRLRMEELAAAVRI